ncbi:hypothetical protein LAZ67_23000727 [Cordylochernes scorpioides]|uniref:Uncharacterized protein n=1 Tax=Cordylochernes scorpioides TaxID=51811 RepID=A0ABY6LR55_9ARAC|nr:hypothetical protein LAZ67_23000727 [Cordylochernes scorpioides]
MYNKGSDMEECEQREEESHTYGEILKIIKTGELYTLRYFSGGHGKGKLVMGFLCYKCRVREMRLSSTSVVGDYFFGITVQRLAKKGLRARSGVVTVELGLADHRGLASCFFILRYMRDLLPDQVLSCRLLMWQYSDNNVIGSEKERRWRNKPDHSNETSKQSLTKIFTEETPPQRTSAYPLTDRQRQEQADRANDSPEIPESHGNQAAMYPNPKELKGKRFDSDEDVQKVVQDFSTRFLRVPNKEGIYKLPERWRRCIESQELITHLNPYAEITRAREIARSRTQNKHKKDKETFEKQHRTPHFEMNDLVLVKNYRHPDTGKLAPYFTGPYTVIEIISPNVVRIDRPNQPINRDSDTIHVNKLKYYTENVLYITPPQTRFIQDPQRMSPDVYLSEFKHLTPDIFETLLYRIIPPQTSQPFLHLNPDLFNSDRFKTNLK